MFEALQLDKSPYGTRTLCSWADAGWRSLLVQVYDDRPVVEEMCLPAIEEQGVVLATHGRSIMESSSDGRWRSAWYEPGQIGMTAPGRPTRLRWRSTTDEQLRSVHVYVPARVMKRVAAELWETDREWPDFLAGRDPLLEQMIRALVTAAAEGAPDMYAETAAEFLAVHTLTRYSKWSVPTTPAHEDSRVRRAVEFMRDNLHLQLTLADIAREAGLSAFHFVRVFKAATGETPHRHLTALRVDAARRHLDKGVLPVGEIAYLCGFANPAHLSTAFTRHIGMSPSAYRRRG
ncbi:AraC family transcriptional regulator [Actinocrispum sp. NPDC049592]|uniref:AraC family transcriptional regulator n=1 Tax=Actinocrispum sp. NPDC049592 TaxID=3154835 RepID=UPI00343DAD1E